MADRLSGLTTPARVLVALDSFKGTLGAADACAAVAQGWHRERPLDTLVLRPMADGGEGTLEAFAAAHPKGLRVPLAVRGPDAHTVETCWLRLPPSPDAPHGTAVVELANTSGIELLAGRALRPLDADTVGFGQAIDDALHAGVSRLILGIGGSASTDGGTGLLTALGARFLDAHDSPLPPGGRGLTTLHRVDFSDLLPLPPGGAVVVTDVRSPLLGPDGAAAVFSPQKGASPVEVSQLEAGLRRLASHLSADPSTPGAGAAGGAGFALLHWGATLLPGARAVADLVGLPAALADADLVITGEGTFDDQSLLGKVTGYVLKSAVKAEVPACVIAGTITGTAARDLPAAAVELCALSGSTARAMAEPAHWVREAAATLARNCSG